MSTRLDCETKYRKIDNFYSSLIDFTFNVSPCTSPLTSDRRWSCFFELAIASDDRRRVRKSGEKVVTLLEEPTRSICMASQTLTASISAEALPDDEVIRRVLAGETALYEIIMRRYNQRLYRVMRSILRDEDEVEDVMQDAYVRAYRHLADFAGRSQFSTWLARIAIHEAFARVRRGKRIQQLDEVFPDGGTEMVAANSMDSERHTSNGELAGVLEDAILKLPENLRTVLMLRDVEELSTQETAAALNLSEENVKTRLHRGRAMVRRNIYQRVGKNATQAFLFMGVRCDRVVSRVFQVLGQSSSNQVGTQAQSPSFMN